MIRKQFLDFFSAQGGPATGGAHVIVPSSSLIPDDPSVLLTTAGMQQFKKYFTGEADPMTTIHPNVGKPLGSKNVASIQKSFRTSDIDEVGDESHLTFFEMLGNFSFGGYGKREAIRYAWEFFNEIFEGKLDAEVKRQKSKGKTTIQNSKVFITVFGGDGEIPADEESLRIWCDEIEIPEELIERRGREDNFWGPTGNEGPCGPTTEIFINGVEVWNLVFNEYYCNADGSMRKLDIAGVDTGMGLERLAMIAQNKNNIFETDLFDFIMRELPDKLPLRTRRIIADHTRAIAFLISDGLLPSNKEAGYVLRRLLRRVIAFAEMENIGRPPEGLLKSTVEAYKIFPEYSNLDYGRIEEVYKEEYARFLKTVGHGRKEFEKEADRIKRQKIYIIPRAFGFNLFQSAGITIDILDDFARKEGVEVDKKAFIEDLGRHKKISRAGQEKKFGGHGLILNTGELKAADEEEVKIVTRLHTATHLLQAALRAVLGPGVRQMGSDITAERTRFDFSSPRKLTISDHQLVEEWVNDKIRRDLPMTREEKNYKEAIESGALYFFREKYPERVSVYSVVDSKSGEIISRELCGGPHVEHTGEIGHFRIVKEEAVSAGARRIRAVVD